MPWQSVSSLFVVGGMFNVVAGLVGGIHYLSEGVSTHRRSTDWIEVWFEELDGLLLAFSLTLLVLGKVDVILYPSLVCLPKKFYWRGLSF